MAKRARTPNPTRDRAAKLATYAAARAGGASQKEAAIAAGYAASRAQKTAEEIDASAEGKAALAAARADVAAALRARSVVDADRLRVELEAVGLSDVTDLFEAGADGLPRVRPLRDWPEAARRAVAGVKVRRYVEGSGESAREVEILEFKLWPKVPALQELGLLLGLRKQADLEVTMRATGSGAKRLLVDLELPGAAGA